MTTTPLPPQPAATYTLTIVADSGYESTMEGQCDAEQYALAVKALHEPAAARADLEAENKRLREALEAILDEQNDNEGYAKPATYDAAYAALEKQP